jgi:hypothetical protein
LKPGFYVLERVYARSMSSRGRADGAWAESHLSQKRSSEEQKESRLASDAAVIRVGYFAGCDWPSTCALFGVPGPSVINIFALLLAAP